MLGLQPFLDGERDFDDAMAVEEYVVPVTIPRRWHNHRGRGEAIRSIFGNWIWQYELAAKDRGKALRKLRQAGFLE